MRFLKRSGAFTLIEIIAVISIIIILIGLLSPAINRARGQARIQEAKAMIGSLEVACGMYFNDVGDYPSSLSKLMSDSNTGWKGPYMDQKKYDGLSFDDPWGNDYIYKEPGVHNIQSIDIYSRGPDEADGSDDITNW